MLQKGVGRGNTELWAVTQDGAETSRLAEHLFSSWTLHPTCPNHPPTPILSLYLLISVPILQAIGYMIDNFCHHFKIQQTQTTLFLSLSLFFLVISLLKLISPLSFLILVSFAIFSIMLLYLSWLFWYSGILVITDLSSLWFIFSSACILAKIKLYLTFLLL